MDIMALISGCFKR